MARCSGAGRSLSWLPLEGRETPLGMRPEAGEQEAQGEQDDGGACGACTQGSQVSPMEAAQLAVCRKPLSSPQSLPAFRSACGAGQPCGLGMQGPGGIPKFVPPQQPPFPCSCGTRRQPPRPGARSPRCPPAANTEGRGVATGAGGWRCLGLDANSPPPLAGAPCVA